MFSIFDKLGGIDATLDVISRRRGKPRLGLHSVRAWMFYRKIPEVNVLALMQECQARNIPFDMTADCMLPTPPKKSAAKSFPRRRVQRP